MMSMRIATYNVNGINGRLANLVGWLEETTPDIVCLQELKAPDDKLPAAGIRAAGYGAVWHGQKSESAWASICFTLDSIHLSSPSSSAHGMGWGNTTLEIQVTCYAAESHDTIHLPLSWRRWPEGQSMYCRDPLGCHRIGSARGHDHMWYEYAEGG
jgi:Endonuclease/Exonuclease/phosphatase family